MMKGCESFEQNGAQGIVDYLIVSKFDDEKLLFFMSNQKLKLSIGLTSKVYKDEETGLFIAKFVNIPNAIAYDESPESAMIRLISVFEVLLKEQKEMVYEEIIRKQLEQAFQEEPSYEFIRVKGKNEEDEEMKLQMVLP